MTDDKKCGHPLDSIGRYSQKPWEGICRKCKKKVILKAVPND